MRNKPSFLLISGGHIGKRNRRDNMISRDTAARIWNAYREIEAGEKLLADMAEIRKSERIDKYAPTLKDAFGTRRQLQLGIPQGDNGHRLLDVSPILAESCIRVHIERKRAELAEANESAWLELNALELSGVADDETTKGDEKSLRPNAEHKRRGGSYE
jgi:hypothetical protein